MKLFSRGFYKVAAFVAIFALAGVVYAAGISGGPGNDTLNGTASADTIHGNGGNDTIDGKAGNDTLYGDYGDDYIQGGDGDDIIYGGPGSDDIHGGHGNDKIYIDGGDAAQYEQVHTGGGLDTVYFTNQSKFSTTRIYGIANGDKFNTTDSWKLIDSNHDGIISVQDNTVALTSLTGGYAIYFQDPGGRRIYIERATPFQLHGTGEFNWTVEDYKYCPIIFGC